MAFPYNNILNIPERCLIQKRLTKTFFLKNFDLSATEKKLLNNYIRQMVWLASIKPINANIPEFKNEEYVYDEIQVMICTLPNDVWVNYADKCIALFQKYIPYQMLVIVEDENQFVLNGCDKRINKNDVKKRTIERYFTTAGISKLYKKETSNAFFEALNFTQLDKRNLETTYKSYIRAIVQYQTASITGAFTKRMQQRTEEDMANILTIEKLKDEITTLKSLLIKQNQLNNKVELNIEIHKKREQISLIKNKLELN